MDRIVISLQKSIDLLPDGVLIVDEQSCIVMCNNQCCRMFGYKPGDLTGKQVDLLLPEEYRLSHPGHVTKFFQKPSLRSMGEGVPVVVMKKDKTEFDVDVAISPVVINQKKLTIAVVRDITDIMNLERSLHWKNEQLEVINKELEQFSLTISHDLKSPLANIQAIIHHITRELPKDKQHELQEHIDHLNQTLQAMGNLISGVAAYSKATQTNPKAEKVDMNDVLKEVKALLLLPSNMKLEIASHLPVTYCNRTKLLQVFLNLLTNAIKYNDKPKGIIKIDSQQSGHHVAICIEDNGPGIPPELRDKVFRLFEKGDSDRKDSQGIGLAIVNKVIKELGGSIKIIDGELGGAKFQIILPGLNHQKHASKTKKREKHASVLHAAAS